jgi:ABC-type transport system involved in multi-copper enzyme maturation permease subunit
VKLRDLLGRLNRLQQSRGFKIVASIAVVAAAVAVFASYAVARHTPADGSPAAAQAEPGLPPDASAEDLAAERQLRSAADAGERAFEDILAKRASSTSVGIAIAILTGLVLVVIWLGLALSYLGLFLVAAVLVLPMRLLADSGWAERTRFTTTTSTRQVLSGLSFLISAAVILTAAFAASMQAARVLLAGGHPVSAIARNALAEAVRMKVSLVFIVLMIFALAALPLLLDPTTPLRYRVQSFLQYGTGGAFWIIAVLVLLFAAGTVAFEQRDRQIWQTMTKPVASWEYILGKWLGVSTLAAVLLMVCSSGIFVFTEYLRQQPAEGEQVRDVTAAAKTMTEDRYILESQVLTARVPVKPVVPYKRTDVQFQRGVAAYIEQARVTDPSFAGTSAAYEKVEGDLFKSLIQDWRSIRAGEYRDYTFRGLESARRRNSPLTLRYRVDSGSNDPRDLYRITFVVGNMVVMPAQEVGLGPTHSLSIPAILDDKGDLSLRIVNGELRQGPDGQLGVLPNRDLISIPEGGLEVQYSAGSYQGNFFRVAAVLWVKLAFLAMLAITASTFLSFPVACLIAFAIFIAAEMSGFLSTSLEYYDAMDEKGAVILWKVLVRAIGLAVAWMFKTYNGLKPVERLVDGRLLDWGRVAGACAVLLAWTGALYVIAVSIFRRRELATYSGQ